jgi:hypothetical protein
MAGPSTAERRPQTRAVPRTGPSSPRRPPLRVFEPTPRRRPAIRRVRRSTMWLSAVLVVGSLLAVVVGDAMVSDGQVRLSTIQGQLATATATQKGDQVAVARKAAPPVVVALAKQQGMVPAATVSYLPQVPLNVPLPVPQTAPLAAT